MEKLTRGALVLICSFLLMSCSDEAAVTEIEVSALNDIILEDDGSILDEIPLGEDGLETIDVVLGEDLEEIVDPDVIPEPEVIVEEEPPIIEDEPVIVVDEEPPAEEDPPIVVDEESLFCEMRPSLQLVKLDESESILGDVKAFKGPFSTRVNYNYYSASAHPIIGPHPEKYEGHFFFYKGSDGLSLNFFYNIDAGGSSNNQVKMDIEVKGNGGSDKVMISDDGSELKLLSSDSENSKNLYQAKMHYWYNTDGGAIGPLQGENFKIHIKMYSVGDNKKIAFYSADGRSVLLENVSESPLLYSEFIINYEGLKEACNLTDQTAEENSCLSAALAQNQELLEESEWRTKWDAAIRDRREQLQKMAQAQREFLSKKTEEYRVLKNTFKTEANLVRQKMVATMRSERKAKQEEIQLAREELFSALKDIRLEMLQNHRIELKNFSGERADKIKLRDSLRETRRALQSDHRQKMKEFNSDSKAVIKAINQKFKDKIQEFNASVNNSILQMREKVLIKRKELIAQYKVERRLLADSLMKQIKTARAEWMKVEKRIKESFVKDVELCKAS